VKIERGDKFVSNVDNSPIWEVVGHDKEAELVFLGTLYDDFLTNETMVDCSKIGCWDYNDFDKFMTKYKPAEVE